MERPRPAEPEQLAHSRDHSCAAGQGGALRRRLLLWREAQLLRRALKLAGEPNLLLDLSPEAGRCWPLLAEHDNRVILAAGPSQQRLDAVLAAQPAGLAERVRVFQGSAAALLLPDNAVDCILGIGLLPCGAEALQLRQQLRELRRVTRDTLILSLPAGRFPAGKAIEGELVQAGFDILGRYGLLPGYSTSWIYVVRKED